MKTSDDFPDAQLDGLIIIINQVYGYDFSGYSRASTLRRLQRFLLLNGYTAGQLMERIGNDQVLFGSLLEALTVNVTGFFRDSGFYRCIREEVIPQLLTYPVIRVWHAGCATGEEVYSMAIMLSEAGILHKSLLYATDISRHALSVAKKGFYRLDSMHQLFEQYRDAGGTGDLASYAGITNNTVTFDETLKQRMVFSHHNLVTDQVFNGFNLILCRNVFIYFNRELQRKVLSLFIRSLVPLGYLALGNKETIDFLDKADSFETVNRNQKIYRLRGGGMA